MLKVAIKQGPLWARLLPSAYADLPQSFGERLLTLLNKTHPALGVATILLAAAHAGLSSSGRLNLFLWLTMCVLLWQGGFGLFLKARKAPVTTATPFILSW